MSRAGLICLLSVVVLFTAVESRPGKSHPAPTKAGKALQHKVKYATGSIPTECAPVEYYYVDASNILFRKDQKVDTPVKIADKVALAFTAWDDSTWYLTVDGKVFRLHYNTDPEEVTDIPSGVKFAKLAPVSFDETYAATDSGDIYRYVANKWFKLDPKSSDKKTSISVGVDGFLLASDRASSKIYSFDHEKQKFNKYDVSGVSADVYDEDHVVVVKDTANNVQVKSGGKWTDVKEKCRRTSASSADQFYCTTPEGDVKLVK